MIDMITRTPWTISKNIKEAIYDADGNMVCILGISYRTKEQIAINANLLLVAPEMYDVLEDLDEILSTALHNGHHDLIARVKSILKKARGES